ncbi:unnamed protein product [Rotaria sp. Silwood2]|nr:unnamed protein product [Rotaria sp. Silwood2]CAF4335654.1 unnamed protein product [Rotaria sp. Silwood2]
MVHIKTLLAVAILVLISATIDQASAGTCECGLWNGAYTFKSYNGVSGYCSATCSFGYAATGDANACCKCCCEQRTNYIGSCNTASTTTCSPTDSSCSVNSIYPDGLGFTFYTYFAGSGPTANGGAAAYCPGGTRNYVDCVDACKGDTNYDPCVRCCNACCTSGTRTSRVLSDNDDNDDLLAILRIVSRARAHARGERRFRSS